MHFSCQSWQRGRWPASLSAALAVLLSDAIELKFMTKPLTKLPPLGDCAPLLLPVSQPFGHFASQFLIESAAAADADVI